MAGMGTRDIKRKIKSVNSTMQITKAMELVSTAKLKKAKDKFERTKPYFSTVLDSVQTILKNNQGIRHEYLEERVVRKTLYIIVSADRGLCGGYNVNALQTAIRDMRSREQSVLITVGKKAKDFFQKNQFTTVEEYIHISEKPSYTNAQRIASTALKLFTTEQVDEIKLVYTKMLNTMSQEATILNLLPVRLEVGEEGEESDEIEEATAYEPSPEEVLSYLIPLYIESTIYGALVESSSAEQAARRIAMENATDNAEEMIESLTLTFNQARQASITQEISEIVGGANALE